MKLLKAVPAVVMLAGGVFASLYAAADDSVLLSWMIPPPRKTF